MLVSFTVNGLILTIRIASPTVFTSHLLPHERTEPHEGQLIATKDPASALPASSACQGCGELRDEGDLHSFWSFVLRRPGPSLYTLRPAYTFANLLHHDCIMGKYSNSDQWQDVVPIPQDDGGPNPLAAIAYTEEYSEAMSYLRAIMADNEKSERVLGLTEDIIRMNPAHYTVWFVHQRSPYVGLS